VLITLLLFMTTSNNLIKQFQTVILIATLATLIPYLYTTISSIILALKHKRKPTYHLWKHISISLFAGLFSCWAIFSSGEETIKYGCIILISTLPLYAWQRYQKRAHEPKNSPSFENVEVEEPV
jgi:APA family basic amino acid/polyamine antiporter